MSCEDCPYNEEIYVEEIDGCICEGLLNYGYCYYADYEE